MAQADLRLRRGHRLLARYGAHHDSRAGSTPRAIGGDRLLRAPGRGGASGAGPVPARTAVVPAVRRRFGGAPPGPARAPGARRGESPAQTCPGSCGPACAGTQRRRFTTQLVAIDVEGDRMRRRDYGSGGLRKRGNSWQATLWLPRDPDTQRRTRTTFTAATRKEAWERRSGYQRRLEHGLDVVGAGSPLGEYSRRWLREHASRSVSARTLAGYEQTGRLFVASIGSVRLPDLRTPHIEKALAAYLRSGASNRTAAKHLAILRAALARAVVPELIPHNRQTADSPLLRSSAHTCTRRAAGGAGALRHSPCSGPSVLRSLPGRYPRLPAGRRGDSVIVRVR